MAITKETAPGDLDGTISVDALREFGMDVRSEAGIDTGADAFSECRGVSQTLTDRLHRSGIEARVLEAHMGEARETHFCVYLPADAVEDRDGSIIVDPTMDQFCMENARNGKTDVNFGPEERLPSVAIHESGAEERTVWYHRPKTPHDTFRQFPYDKR